MSHRITGAMVLALACLVAAPATGVTRDQIMAKAVEYAEHVWACEAFNMKADCSSGYESDYGPGTYVGVPYDWGGFDTLAQFDTKLTEAYGAGSHSWHGVLSCTTGVDCSGFVSRCWQTSKKQSTSSVHNVSYPIEPAEILEGDIYNDPGSHMVLWVGVGSDGAPLFYEASGSASKVRFNAGATWSYLNGYTSVRYEGVWEGEGTPSGSIDSPIVIDSFPFHDEYSTYMTGNTSFDAYACAPDTGELGPEVIYIMELNQPGFLEADVADGPGVDIDIHLLWDLDPSACIERNDLHIGPVSLEAGTYFLVADSWSNSGGTHYAGSYSLDVTFEPTGPVVEEEEEDPVDEDPVEEERIPEPEEEVDETPQEEDPAESPSQHTPESASPVEEVTNVGETVEEPSAGLPSVWMPQNPAPAEKQAPPPPAEEGCGTVPGRDHGAAVLLFLLLAALFVRRFDTA